MLNKTHNTESQIVKLLSHLTLVLFLFTCLTVIFCLMKGDVLINASLGDFCHCENIRECMYTNQDGYMLLGNTVLRDPIVCVVCYLLEHYYGSIDCR